MKYVYTILTLTLVLGGCAREYRCDAGPPCEVDDEDTAPFVVLGTVCDAIITVDWPEGEMEAEVACDEMYNNTPNSQQSCTCVKDN